MEEKKLTERRSFKRRETREGLFAVTEPYTAVHGRVVNLSESGLTFQYVDKKERPEDNFNLSVFLKGNGILLESVEVKTVSDFEMDYFDQVELLNLRLCGVKFLYLKKSQQMQLELILKKHTFT